MRLIQGVDRQEYPGTNYQPEHQPYIERSLAAKIGEYMLEEGVFKVEVNKGPDQGRMGIPVETRLKVYTMSEEQRTRIIEVMNILNLRYGATELTDQIREILTIEAQ